MQNDRVGLAFAVLIATVWATITIDSLFTQNFIALEYLTPLMSVAAAFAFTKSNGRRNGNGNGKGKKGDDEQ